MEDRGTGRTTKQMLAAPEGAVFVWVSSQLFYPMSLAHKLRRDDLTIVSPCWLSNMENILGLRKYVVYDHSFSITSFTQLRGMSYIRSYRTFKEDTKADG